MLLNQHAVSAVALTLIALYAAWMTCMVTKRDLSFLRTVVLWSGLCLLPFSLYREHVGAWTPVLDGSHFLLGTSMMTLSWDRWMNHSPRSWGLLLVTRFLIVFAASWRLLPLLP